MADSIQISDNLYELHCKRCDEILGILEVFINNWKEHEYLCEHCDIIINEEKLLEQVVI